MFLNIEEKIDCVKNAKIYVSIHCHHIGLQNSCHVRDNITFNVSSILQMHDSKFLLYLKATAYQYLLSNKKSSKYIHTRLEC